MPVDRPPVSELERSRIRENACHCPSDLGLRQKAIGLQSLGQSSSGFQSTFRFRYYVPVICSEIFNTVFSIFVCRDCKCTMTESPIQNFGGSFLELGNSQIPLCYNFIIVI